MAHVAQDAKRKEEKRQRMPRKMANLCVDFLMCFRLWSRTHRKKAQEIQLLLPPPIQNKLSTCTAYVQAFPYLVKYTYTYIRISYAMTKNLREISTQSWQLFNCS